MFQLNKCFFVDDELRDQIDCITLDIPEDEEDLLNFVLDQTIPQWGVELYDWSEHPDGEDGGFLTLRFLVREHRGLCDLFDRTARLKSGVKECSERRDAEIIQKALRDGKIPEEFAYCNIELSLEWDDHENADESIVELPIWTLNFHYVPMMRDDLIALLANL